MAWSNSKIGRQTIADLLANTTAMAWDDDTIKFALYNNSITPDNDVTAANFAYNAGQWATANEVADGAEWPAGGVTLGSKTIDVGTADTVKVDAADAASGSSATLANVHGGLAYSDSITTPVADQAWCYLYFGGAQSVTDGVMTIVFNTAGLMSFAL